MNGIDEVNGEAALTAAAYFGKTEACELMVNNHHADLNVRNRNGLTPLLKAVEHVSDDAITVLVLLFEWTNGILGSLEYIFENSK